MQANIRILNAANIAEKIWQLQDAVIGHVGSYHIEASEKTSGSTLQTLVLSFIVHKIYCKIFPEDCAIIWQMTGNTSLRLDKVEQSVSDSTNRVNGDISVSSGRNGHERQWRLHLRVVLNSLVPILQKPQTLYLNVVHFYSLERRETWERQLWTWRKLKTNAKRHDCNASMAPSSSCRAVLFLFMFLSLLESFSGSLTGQYDFMYSKFLWM